MIPHMEAVGQAEGISFKYGGKIGNTRDSHRLIAEAGERGEDIQDRLVNALFHEYFEVNNDISDKATLARIAKEVGLFESEEEGLEFLKSEKRGPEVDQEVEFNQYRRGISGVPHFTIEGIALYILDGADSTGQAEVSGAQEPRLFERIFQQVETLKDKDIIADGKACLPDGSNC
jgi:predicted DsbA family dithiol-disulfide isomerase